MKKKKNKNKSDDYFTISIGIGLILGVLFNQIALGLIFGCAIGLILSNDNDDQEPSE